MLIYFSSFFWLSSLRTRLLVQRKDNLFRSENSEFSSMQYCLYFQSSSKIKKQIVFFVILFFFKSWEINNNRTTLASQSTCYAVAPRYEVPKHSNFLLCVLFCFKIMISFAQPSIKTEKFAFSNNSPIQNCNVKNIKSPLSRSATLRNYHSTVTFCYAFHFITES